MTAKRYRKTKTPKTDIRIEYPSRGETYFEKEYAVYEYGEYPSSSVLAGQESRKFLDAFQTLEEAQQAYPDAVYNGPGVCGYTPPYLNHLPDDSDY